MVTASKGFGWGELLGLALVPVVLLPQLWVVGCALFWPDLGLGSFPSPRITPAPEAMSFEGILWGLWAFFATPVAFVQAFVLMPLVALRILRRPTRQRRLVVLLAIALSMLGVGLSCLILAA
jgi:hypothetical protein